MNGIESVINSLIDNIYSNDKDELLKLIGKTKINHPVLFAQQLTKKSNALAESVVRTFCTYKHDDYPYFVANKKSIEWSFSRLLERLEGSACCSDKARTIVNRLDAYLVTGEEIHFNYDQLYTYQLPDVINTHDKVIKAYQGIVSANHGNYEPIIKFISYVVKGGESTQK